MARLNQILFGIFLFIFPFSVRFLVYEENAYRFGNFSPWVSEFVYLPEILLVLTFGLWVFMSFPQKWESIGSRLRGKDKLMLVLLLLFILNAFLITLWRGDPILALFFLWRVLEIFMLYALIVGRVLDPPKIIRILLGGALFQMALGLLQWKFNHSLGLAWLGEPMIGPEILNVAKINLAEGSKHIRAYGTFLHSNILAGYFLILFFLAFDYFKARSKILWLLLIGLGLWLTQSLAAALVGIAYFLFWIFFKFFPQREIQKLFSFFIILFLILGNTWSFLNSDRLGWATVSYPGRPGQKTISREMIKAHPLGVGLRNFTLEMENFTERKLVPWEFQPVHNAYFLILNETGVQGLILFLAMISSLFLRLSRFEKILPIFCLLLLAPFDHFLWDSWVGMMMVGITAGLSAPNILD